MEDIVRFLSVNYGFRSGIRSGAGSGLGSGSGFASGSGSGFGDSPGDGYGDGSGSCYSCGYGNGNREGYGIYSGSGYGGGYGNGLGDGCGSEAYIKSFQGFPVYIIDGVSTIIFSVKGDFARGAVLQSDLIPVPCWIAKRGGFFAHGETTRSAFAAAEAKYRQHLPIEDRIKAFVAAHPDPDAAYGDLFEWHNTLTGSCELGRREWCKRNGLRPDDSLTLKDFFRMTKNEYGGEVIRWVEKMYLQPGNCRKD